jgi:hypothetical protein
MRWIILLMLISCKIAMPVSTPVIVKCDEQTATAIADNYIKKGGYELTTLKRDVVAFKAIFFYDTHR